MKSFSFMLGVCATLFAACSHDQPLAPVTPPRIARPQSNLHKEQVAQRQYLALPGQSAVRVGTEDADAAFDRQVEAYSGGTATTPSTRNFITETAGTTPAPSANTYVTAAPASPVDNIPTPHPAEPIQATAPTPQPVPEPAPVASATGAANIAVQPEPAAPVAVPAPTTVEGTADYAVQITNGTAGRIFVEAQDAAGHIFPCGPMFGGQSINTPPDPIGPLQGPITVVVRDPDKDGAPEIRRYKVQPPAEYKGKTVGITILPGGQYRADVDKEVYYTSPAPDAAPATPAPATPTQAAQAQ